MRVFDGIIERLLPGRSLTAVGGRPFAAPPQMVDFAGDAVMRPVTQDYQRHKQDWPIKHLPVVVGQLRPEAMQLLGGVAEDPDINIHFNFKKTGFADVAQEIGRRLMRRNLSPQYRVSSELRDHIAARNLHNLWAGLASEIFAQDAAWFGKSTVPSMTLHRETIIPRNEYGHHGKGRYTFAGQPHRDCLSDDNAAYSRLYLVRTSNPFWALPNRETQGIKAKEDGYIEDSRIMQLERQHAVRPQAGQILLVNGGLTTGTVHASTIPGPQQGGPSFFAAVNCVL